MKPNDMEQDARLTSLLQEWQVTDTLPPRFQESVWRKIARNEAPARGGIWQALRRWFDAPIPRPAVAFAYVLVLTGVGLATGYWQGHETIERVDTTLGQRYLSSVNPYQSQMAAHQ
jgi:hypothetical protein